jgi:tyrosyl-tRNA synthetase
MSKSLNNYIGITEDPKEMFGKVMSISDELMWRYYELLSLDKSIREIKAMHDRARRGEVNPRDCKVELAKEIVARFHDRKAADDAVHDFERRFRQRELPEDIPEVRISIPEGGMRIANLLKEAGLTSSTSDALRMVQQGAVRLDGERVSDKSLVIESSKTHIVQVGKRRYARVTPVRSNGSTNA